MSMRNLIFKNLGLKVLALFIALLVWTIITGRERASDEMTLRIPVEIVNPPLNIEVKSIRPEEVQVSVQGKTQLLNALGSRSLTVRIDLARFSESAKLQFFAEDYIEKPESLSILSVHPKMVEIHLEELISKTVAVRLTSRGRLPAGFRPEDLRINPTRVTIYGYRSEIDKLTAISSEEIDLAALEPGVPLTVSLKQGPEILKFVDSREIQVLLAAREKQDNGRPK